jgi:hypothetical protein
MKIFSFVVLSFVVMIFESSCKCQDKNMKSEESTMNKPVEDFAIQKFVDGYTIDYNTNNEYAIVSKMIKTKPNDIFPTVSFYIVEIETMEILFKDVVPRGKVFWTEDYIVELKSENGIPNSDGETQNSKAYKYHVKNRKKYSGSFLKKSH